MDLHRKRAYDTTTADDGFRVLIDGVAARSQQRERGHRPVSNDIATTTELRHDWHAAPDSEWDALTERYRQQLQTESTPALQELAETIRGKPVGTLVYALKNTEHNPAVVLGEILRLRLRE